jgi:hypothetical protein
MYRVARSDPASKNKGIIRQESTCALSPAKLYASAGDLRASILAHGCNRWERAQQSRVSIPGIGAATVFARLIEMPELVLGPHGTIEGSFLQFSLLQCASTSGADIRQPIIAEVSAPDQKSVADAPHTRV